MKKHTSIKQQGFSIVENLIAMTIVIAVFTVAFKVITSSIMTNSILEKKVTIEEALNNRILEFIITDTFDTTTKDNISFYIDKGNINNDFKYVYTAKAVNENEKASKEIIFIK
jgi:type II secretory pathway pseudopilin PulG